MAASRRPVSPVLSLQVATLVVLTAAAVVWVWRAADTRAAVVRAPRQAIQHLRSASGTAVVSPYLFLQTGDKAHIDVTIKAIADAQAEVKALFRLVPEARGAASEAHEALVRIETDMGLIYRAPAGADLTGAMEELELSRVNLDKSLHDLERKVEARAERHYRDTSDGLLALWGGMLLVTLGTALVARRRDQFNEDRGAQATRHLVDNVGTSLRRAANGDDEGKAPEFVEAREFAPLTEAAESAIVELHRLREVNTRIQKTSSFTQDLIDALAMAETEDEVLRVGSRAARVAYPEAGFQLLLIDPEAGGVRAHDEEATAACDLRQVEECPAIRKGRTVHHLVEEGIARCPRIKADDQCVTCALVQVTGRTTAVAQLLAYQPQSTQFEDLEALGLALGARLGVVRSLQARALEAGTDPLTGLANRRILGDRLARLDKSDGEYTLVVSDIDHFKHLNDRYGHDAGDRCLEIFADVLRDACRDSDLPARMGGEEFVIVLPNVGMRAGLSVAMRIRAYLADAARRAPAPFTVSIGVASRPDHGTTAESVLRAADDALYAAKEAGRDQVVPARALSGLGESA
jgi:diguanylate cyclase (GGDEF)-like protein